jgi:hypothetical protein
MKKKLVLKKETLRKLTWDELTRIGGGTGETFTCKCDPPPSFDNRPLSPADSDYQTTGGNSYSANYSFGASDSISDSE